MVGGFKQTKKAPAPKVLERKTGRKKPQISRLRKRVAVELRMSSAKEASALFACSKCFTRHPFEELSQGQQLCKVSTILLKIFWFMIFLENLAGVWKICKFCLQIHLRRTNCTNWQLCNGTNGSAETASFCKSTKSPHHKSLIIFLVFFFLAQED